jgi:hypothetical protein
MVSPPRGASWEAAHGRVRNHRCWNGVSTAAAAHAGTEGGAMNKAMAAVVVAGTLLAGLAAAGPAPVVVAEAATTTKRAPLPGAQGIV